VCPVCGSGRTFPLVDSADLGRLYPDAYDAYSLPPAGLARLLATWLYHWYYRRALRQAPFAVLRRLSPGRLLDVGAGRGDLGVVLAREGWEVTGLEPSGDACEAARRRGVRMVQGTLAGGGRAELGADYDVVVFQHALEHVVEPLDDLRRAYELLRPGGFLLVALPNFGCWQARRFGTAWFHLDLPRHRSHFTAAGLERALRATGFVRPEISTSTTADGLQASIQYRLYGRRRFREGLSRYVVVAISLLLLPLTELANRLGGEGDQLGATAARPDAR